MGTSIHDHDMVTLAMEYAEATEKMFGNGAKGGEDFLTFAQASREITQLFGEYMMDGRSLLSLTNTILDQMVTHEGTCRAYGALMAAYVRSDLDLTDEKLAEYRTKAKAAEIKSGAYRAVIGQILQLCLEGEHTKTHASE